MDFERFMRLLEDDLGNPPVWSPTAKDQHAEFDRWKLWSSRKQFIENVREAVRQQADD